MDLVINHTSKDSVLVAEHPEWFRRDPDGELRSPRAIDPTDPRKFTVWGDLAEIAYDNPNTRPALVEYWVELVRHHLELGFKGFRCDAAYQVPVEVWQPIDATRRRSIPTCRFFAETLGCTPEQALALRAAGFDFLFNSAKWWDFRSPWLLEQYDLYRQIAPTVAFPESHDTERLAHRARRPRAAGAGATLPPALPVRGRVLERRDDADGLRVRLPHAARRGRLAPGRLGVGDGGAAARSHRVRRRGQPHEGGDAGPQRRGSAEEGDRAPQSGRRAAAPIGRRRGIVGRRRDRADQPRSRAPARGSIPGP